MHGAQFTSACARKPVTLAALNPSIASQAVQLKPQQIAAHLKSTLAPLYLVAGEEPLLVQETLDAIRARARAQGFAERTVLDVERGFDWSQVFEAFASLSLFAERRMVEVRMNAGPDAAGAKALQALAQQTCADVLLIVVCGALDARARKAAWFNAFDQAGVTVYAWPVKGRDCVPWLEARLRSAGVRADADAVRLLAERTEGNLLAAAQDVAKLALLFPDQAVSAEALAHAVADSARFAAFDLMDRILEGDGAAALRSLARLREEGATPLEILGALMWGLRQLIKAVLAYGRSRDAQSACEAAGIRRFQQDRYIRAMQRTRAGVALSWLKRAARIDQLVKTGQDSAAWEELITLTVAASGAALISTPPQ
ncbi:DNA polymerase III subunit delta [Sinimarinibacterium sp. NLF-5-8]|uniref:DNA polymerase III subunit delta n=1 Tax=Sinimarinibacterium sp. NLF-5-8 TaxID=2698684 RepID=UPI001EE4983B|nr:DNA polymerase III subunit delta [Sinimarinibacterium sp. NLF-5-8]